MTYVQEDLFNCLRVGEKPQEYLELLTQLGISIYLITFVKVFLLLSIVSRVSLFAQKSKFKCYENIIKIIFNTKCFSNSEVLFCKSVWGLV